VIGPGKVRGRGKGVDKWPQMFRILLNQKRSNSLSNSFLSIASWLHFNSLINWKWNKGRYKEEQRLCQLRAELHAACFRVASLSAPP
jgi:hypothetical protein